MNEQSYYMNIPAEVWDSNITAKAMILYGHISVLSNKKKYCYATNGYFEKVMKCSTSTITRCLKELEDIGIITRQNIYTEGTRNIEMRKIFLNIGIIKNDHRPIVKNEHSPIITDDQDNSTSNNTKISNVLDVPSQDDIKGKIDKFNDDIKGKIYFKIVDNYPANRIGNRQHGLKKFKKLDIKEAKLAGRNLKRYLNLSEGFHKSLQNYITEECWSEPWLKAEETKNNKKDITNTKTFNATYDDLT